MKSYQQTTQHISHKGHAAEDRDRGRAHHDDVGGVTVLQELGGSLQLLAGTAVDLGGDLLELTGDVGSVTVQHRRVAVADLARVVHDDDLRTISSKLSTSHCMPQSKQQSTVLENW